VQIFKILKDYRLLEILILGIISGMPLPIIFSTLSFYLTENQIDIAIITSFAIARLPYSLKIFWAPIVDYWQVPLLGKLGHRKSWLILSTVIIVLVLFLISNITSVGYFLPILYILTIILGFASATFDINVDAFRIDKFEDSMQGLASSSAVLGYRIGMLITGAGALYFAELSGSWPTTFFTISIIFLVLLIFIFTVEEQPVAKDKERFFSKNILNAIIIAPLKDFLTRQNAIFILLAIVFFKLGDAMLGVVSGPFYLKLGFSKGEIASAVKVFGVIATLFGASAGGFIVYKLGNCKGLILTGIGQSLTHFAFIWLNNQAPKFNSLLIAISIENFACGMGSTALASYLATLCNKKYSATQYALLSSSASLFNNSITSYGGTLVNLLGWHDYFILTIIMAIPGLGLIIYLDRKLKNHL
jgi:PAT family beta-lactamase induction signal transducer AmpG